MLTCRRPGTLGVVFTGEHHFTLVTLDRSGYRRRAKYARVFVGTFAEAMEAALERAAEHESQVAVVLIVSHPSESTTLAVVEPHALQALTLG